MKEDRKRSILDAAERCIIADGIEGTTMRMIASEAGINLASLHYYFENKENLLTSLITQKFLDYGSAFMASLNNADPPREQIKSVIDFLKKTVLEDKSTYILLFEYLPCASRNPNIKELLRASYKDFRSSFVRILKRAIGKQNENGMDMEILSSFVISLIDGMWIQLFLDEDAFDADMYIDRVRRLIEREMVLFFYL